MRTVGSPRRARTVWAVPAHWSSSPAPRSRRARNHGARLTLRHSAASIAGEFVRGARPLALRTSSWWTKNSLRLAKRRTQPMRKKPGGGPDRIVATSQGKSSRASAVRRRSAKRPRTGGALVPRGVALARHGVEEGRCVGTELVEQVGEQFRSMASKSASAMSPKCSEGCSWRAPFSDTVVRRTTGRGRRRPLRRAGPAEAGMKGAGAQPTDGPFQGASHT